MSSAQWWNKSPEVGYCQIFQQSGAGGFKLVVENKFILAADCSFIISVQTMLRIIQRFINTYNEYKFL